MIKLATLLVISSILLSSCAHFFRAINVIPDNKLTEISFSEEDASKDYQFYYSDTTGNLYLRELRESYQLDTLVTEQSNEIDKIKAILEWSSSQWEHNGSNTPSKSDALTILKEAEAGMQFRCVEYGVLVAASLNAVGIKARILALKTSDVEKVKFGAGHVVAETYSQQYSKWIFIDPQFNVMPVLNNVPLNGVEFQKALLNERQNIEIVNAEGKADEEVSEFYLDWIGKYLYFFDIKFDNRIDYKVERKNWEGNTKLMLVPLNVENPTIFQRKFDIKKCEYTNTISDFYKNPNLN